MSHTAIYCLLLLVDLRGHQFWQIEFREGIPEEDRLKAFKNCPPALISWIPTCSDDPPRPGLPPDWLAKFINEEMTNVKYLVVVRETVIGSDVRKFPGVLVYGKVVIAICADFHAHASSQQREITVSLPTSGLSRSYVQNSFAVVQPCSFLTNTVSNNPIVLEFALPTSPPPSITTSATVGDIKDLELCQYYSFRHDDPNAADSASESDMESFLALVFVMNDTICKDFPPTSHAYCGSIFDPEMEFCSLLPGGIVFCNKSLLGIARTGCVPQTASFYANKTRFPLWVMDISPSEKSYWESLDRRSYGYNPYSGIGSSFYFHGPVGARFWLSLSMYITMGKYIPV